MLDLKTYIVNVLMADSVLQTYLKDQNGNMNIFPQDVDLQPEQFPCIIFMDSGLSVMSRPQGMHVGGFQLDILSTLDDLQVEQIYTRVAQLLNFKDSTTQTIPNNGILWWMREQNTRDFHETGRRLWRKAIVLKIWISNADQS